MFGFKTSTNTLRVTAGYLSIIMVMSIAFSFVFYRTSASELGRQLPPDSIFVIRGNLVKRPAGFDDFFQNRIDEGRHQLLARLILLNLLTLLMGAGISYWLARRTLEPIEAALDAQTQFVSDASHELRTPLAAMQASNEVALRTRKLTSTEAKALIKNNNEDITRLKALSDALLNLAQQDQQHIELQPVALQDVVSQAMTFIVPQAYAKDIAVEDTVSKLKVLAEFASLQQVLVILLDNAIKYSPEKSTITIHSETKSKSVFLAISDQGIGISDEDLPNIFKRFYRADAARTNNSQHGYGLGLAIAERIMHQYGGSISVTSEPKKGSTFTLRLRLLV